MLTNLIVNITIAKIAFDPLFGQSLKLQLNYGLLRFNLRS